MIKMIDARILKFGLVGITGITIDFSVTWLCKEKFGLNKYVSNSLGFCFAVINNFLLNRYWTFVNTAHPFTIQFFTFALVSLAGLCINNFLLYFLSKYINSNFYLIKLFVTGLVFIWNYSINFLFTFS